MSSKRKVSAAIALASSFAIPSLFTSRTAHAAQTVGSWENNSTEGWFDWKFSGGGADNNNNPGALPFGNSSGLSSFEYAFSTVGATLGTHSMAVTPTTGGTVQNLSLKTQYETDSEGNSEMADAVNNTMFAIDATWNSAQWAANATTFTNTFLTINFRNAAGNYSGFLGLAPTGTVANPNTYNFGYPAYDTGNPGYPGGWDPTDYTGVTTRTMIWDYGDYVPATINVNGTNETNSSDMTLAQLIGTNPQYLEFIITTNSNGNGANPGTYYYDNARFTNPQINATFSAGAHAPGTPYVWGTLANWSSTTTPTSNTAGTTLTNAVPSNAGDIVNFGFNIPAGITETIDLDETQEFQISVGQLNFDNDGSSYLIEQGSGNTTYDTLTLNGNVTSYDYNQTFGASTMTTANGSAEINDSEGNHTISAPIFLATNATIAIGRVGDTFTISGDISGATGSGLTLAGTSDPAPSGTSMLGTVVLSGVNTYTGGTTVSTGTLIAAVAGALPNGFGLVNNGTTDIYGNETLGAASVSALTGTGALNIGDGPATTVHLAVNSGAASEGSLTIAANSALDLGNNHMTLSSDPGGSIDATIRNYLINGYNGGHWNGTSATSGVIVTSAPTTIGGLVYSIGYADGADGVVSGLSSGQLEIKYTLAGDANLDGKVGFQDFNILAANYGRSNATWDEGDFNYDGKVGFQDFNLLAANYGQSVGGNADVVTAADWAALDAFGASIGATISEVPEPATTGLMVVGVLGMLVRRRHRVDA